MLSAVKLIEAEVARISELIRSGSPMVVASADAAGRPSCSRGFGVEIGPDCTLTVYVNATLTERMRADFAANPRIAVTFSRIPDHRSVQLKGVVRSVRPMTPHDRAVQASYLAALAEQYALGGVPRSLTRRMASQPGLAIELEAQEWFEQTPGVGAGRALGATP